jgi:hypothetical protein
MCVKCGLLQKALLLQLFVKTVLKIIYGPEMGKVIIILLHK